MNVAFFDRKGHHALKNWVYFGVFVFLTNQWKSENTVSRNPEFYGTPFNFKPTRDHFSIPCNNILTKVKAIQATEPGGPFRSI